MESRAFSLNMQPQKAVLSAKRPPQCMSGELGSNTGSATNKM